MRDPPRPDVLLALVAEVLAQPGSDYARRVAESLVATVARERVRGLVDDAAETARLIALLGETGDLVQLNTELAERLRDGALTLASPGVAAHLWMTTLAKIAVDRPRYDTTTPRA